MKLRLPSWAILLIICIVVGGMLSMVNSLTAGPIEQRAIEAAFFPAPPPRRSGPLPKAPTPCTSPMPVVLFTFVGVDTLPPGLHSYG